MGGKLLQINLSFPETKTCQVFKGRMVFTGKWRNAAEKNVIYLKALTNSNVLDRNNYS